ncbi:hypothetical protein HXY33_05450 [Candidatus Bathyarchaeota archaeon]|nr:hypothetical protein [Candidatus Bathyarchaeota archaeon]
MEKSLTSLKMGDESHFSDEHSFQCDGCRSEFHKPLLATDSSRGNVQTYYACPRCLSKVDVKHKREVEDSSVSALLAPAKKVSGAKHEAEVKCQHFLGFLKKRDKDTAIPDECLTCEKMIECMVR